MVIHTAYIHFFSMARQPLGGLGRLIFRGFTITHFLDTPHSVGLLWTRVQLVAETSTWQNTTLTTDRHPCPRWDFFFFFACPGFFPFDPFLYCLNPFVLHVTLRSILPSLYNKHNTHIHAPGGIRTHNPSKRAAADPRFRPRGHCDRHIICYISELNLYPHSKL
jgi:hypothetical protein